MMSFALGFIFLQPSIPSVAFNEQEMQIRNSSHVLHSGFEILIKDLALGRDLAGDRFRLRTEAGCHPVNPLDLLNKGQPLRSRSESRSPPQGALECEVTSLEKPQEELVSQFEIEVCTINYLSLGSTPPSNIENPFDYLKPASPQALARYHQLVAAKENLTLFMTLDILTFPNWPEKSDREKPHLTIRPMQQPGKCRRDQKRIDPWFETDSIGDL
jgi:hypothetical protein